MNRKFMEKAILVAKEGEKMGEVPIGAVVVKDGEVIAAAHNLTETKKDPTAHAEILAMRAAAEKLGDFRLTGCELYVTLEPCPMCAGAAANARVSEVIFGGYDKVKGALGSALNLYSYGLPNKPLIYGGIMEKPCTDILKSFFEKRRKFK